MREGTNTRVEFRVAKGDFEALGVTLQGRGPVEIKEIKVAPLMAVSLTSEEENGEPNFRIKRLQDSDEQLVIGDRPTEWSWDVFPTRSGSHRLYLNVSVFLIPPEGGPRRQVKVEERVVTVGISPAYKFARYRGSALSALGGAIAVLLLNWLRRAIVRWRAKARERKAPRIVRG
jgi:hypothetical protein